MPDMSMTEAAKWAGVTRATIHKAIQSGRISAKKNEHGVYQINPAELERAYSPKMVDVSVDSGESGSDIAELTAARDSEITLLREMVSRADAAAADLRAERDAWKAQAESQIRLLTHQKPEPPPIVETKQAPAPPVSRGLIARIFGRG
jgi:hypothetical protein